MKNKIINIPEETIKKISDDVIEHFKAICGVYPRGSKKETAMCNFLEKFTEKLNKNKSGDDKLTFYIQQETREGKPINNIVITKPATKGYEKAESVAFQAHLDMVCQKIDASTHNFDTQAIEYYIDEEKSTMISKNNETTLGADDGIGIAFIMAVLESTEISHPQIQAVFTSDEEDGMSGAKWLDKTKVTAKRFINIDAETEGVLYYGCAGGIYANIDIPAAYTAANKNASFFKINISGLQGGHSGLKIKDGRPNANRLMGRALNHLMNESRKIGADVMLADIGGGTAKNAITKESTAVIAVQNAPADWIDGQIGDILNMFKYEYAALEPDMKVKAELINNAGDAEYNSVLTKDTFAKVVTALMTVPNGVLDMSVTVPGLVETSSNLGVIGLKGSVVSLTCFVRSSVESKKLFVVEQIRMISEKSAPDSSRTPISLNGIRIFIQDCCIYSKILIMLFGPIIQYRANLFTPVWNAVISSRNSLMKKRRKAWTSSPSVPPL